MNFSHEKQPGKNLTGITVVIVLHALVGWAIVSGLATRMVADVKQAVEAEIIEEVKPPPPKEIPPPPPPPEMKAPPPPFIPPVEVNVQQPPPVQNTISQSTNVAPPSKDLARPAPPAPAAKPAPGPVTVAAVVDFNTCARPEYPKNSLRNEETGVTQLQFLIGADGSVKESKLQKSSGFRDLDRAAQNALSRCRFKPGMANGVAQESWTNVQYVWTLE
jgi:protein TonB